MRYNQVLAILFWVTCFIPSASLWAENFLGEVKSVDAAQGTVVVQTTNGQTVEQRVFHLSQIQNSNTALSTIDIGESISLSATNQNGTWVVQNLLTNPLPGTPNGVLVSPPNAGTPQNNAVLASSNNVSVIPGTAPATGVNTLNSTFTGTTVTPTGVTTSGGTGATNTGNPLATTLNGAAGTPTRNGAEGVPARNGAEGISQSTV